MLLKIGLHDSDKTSFPNLALMKLSAYHKSRGHSVEWWYPLEQYDRVYSSKVFSFTPVETLLPPDTVKGGTGYGMYTTLPECAERMNPDYSIYPGVDYAIGFLTRGCIRKCPWCVVPIKEGGIRPYRDWRQIKRADSRDIVFMDNNVLACEYGIRQMESMIGQNVRVDFNQGLDARLITHDVARILSRLKWIRFIRMSADTDAMLETVLDKIEMLKSVGVKPYRVFVYVLVQDVESAERRAIALRNSGVLVFAQAYRDFKSDKLPNIDLIRFERWVNNKAIFNSVERFKDYRPSVKKNPYRR